MVDYEEVWRGAWNDTTRYGPACRHRRRIVGQLVGKVPHQTIVDLGCGDGSLLHELSAQYPEATLRGSDVSAEAVQQARRNVPEAQLEVLDLQSAFSIPPADVAVLSEVLEHIEDDEAVLERLAPVVKYVVISVPGGPEDKVDYQYGHFRNYYEDTLPRKLERCGFETMVFRRWGIPFYDLMLFFSQFTPNAAAMAGGAYSPAKVALARLGYALFSLNLPIGSQVFAVGRSTVAEA